MKPQPYIARRQVGQDAGHEVGADSPATPLHQVLVASPNVSYNRKLSHTSTSTERDNLDDFWGRPQSSIL
jgi:hypothetical protein